MMRLAAGPPLSGILGAAAPREDEGLECSHACAARAMFACGEENEENWASAPPPRGARNVNKVLLQNSKQQRLTKTGTSPRNTGTG